MSDYVAIIGTRKPDENQELAAFELARRLNSAGIRTRTGAAFGVDNACMRGSVPSMLSVVLPWASYNREIVPAGCERIVFDPRVHDHWNKSVDKYHPKPSALTRGARALHARNFGIIEPCVAVVAMPDENGGGGTAQGIRIAKDLGISVFQHNRFNLDMSVTDIVRAAAEIIRAARQSSLVRV